MQTVTIFHNSVSGTSGVKVNQYWNGSEFTETVAKVKSSDIQTEINKAMLYIENNLCILSLRIKRNPSELQIQTA